MDVKKKPKGSKILLSKSQLKKKYHITDKIISLLGNPDEIKPNPYYRSAAPMQLYNEKRVEKFLIELEKNQPEILEQMQKRQKISKSASKKAIKTKQNNTKAIIKQLIEDFEIEPYNIEEISILAERQFYSFVWNYRNNPEDNTWTPSENANLAYIRHNLTNYEEIFSILKGKVGRVEAYTKFRNAIDEMIFDDYKEKLDNLKKDRPGLFKNIQKNHKQAKLSHNKKEQINNI